MNCFKTAKPAFLSFTPRALIQDQLGKWARMLASLGLEPALCAASEIAQINGSLDKSRFNSLLPQFLPLLKDKL